MSMQVPLEGVQPFAPVGQAEGSVLQSAHWLVLLSQ
jgi:hypothetical protein